VSVDYLSRPLDIFKEMHRVLKPVSMGGKFYDVQELHILCQPCVLRFVMC
jgi:hypothetical protein